MIKGRVNVVIGGQAGSESKGKLAALLAARWKPEMIIMAASPNAGHTAWVPEGDGNVLRKHVTYHLPVSWTAHPDAKVFLGPTSVINIETLFKEMLAVGIRPSHLMIHPRATIIHMAHIRSERELGLLGIGSTNQGVGVARSDKLLRRPDVTFAYQVEELQPFLGNTTEEINNRLYVQGETALLEATQGFDLDLEHGIHPMFCTSKMINVSMCLAEAGLSPKTLGHVYGVVRSYPIRVNNREGSSGPYDDAAELSWEEVSKRCGCPHLLGEMTTTTKLPRRIFEFSANRFAKFCMVNRPDYLCLQFANYLNWKDLDVTKEEDLSSVTMGFIHSIQSFRFAAPVAYVGTGETTMVDTGYDQLWVGTTQVDRGRNEGGQNRAKVAGPVPGQDGKGGHNRPI